MLLAQKGKIKVVNTLESRMDLISHQVYIYHIIVIYYIIN